MKKQISDTLIKKIQNIIDTYGLFSQQKDVVVAYSGGKDSLFTCIALKSLGFNVIPVTIDIGYNFDWSIAKQNLKNYGLQPLIIDNNFLKDVSPKEYDEVCGYFEIVKNISKRNSGITTICTPCYNAKLIALKSWAENSGTKIISFGHHSTDVIVSLLKNFYFYVDRWSKEHEKFQIKNIHTLIATYKKNFFDLGDRVDGVQTFSDIKKLISEGVVGTDEPVRQMLTDTNIQIVRPLFTVFESEIKNYYDGVDIKFAEMECLDFRTGECLTCREFIQTSLKGLSTNVMNELQKVTFLSLNHDGMLLTNVRGRRKEILGLNYKCENICDNKL